MKILFTLHAEKRLKRRKITKQEIEEAVKYASKVDKKDNKYYIQANIGKGNIEIVFEKSKYIKIITIYWIE